MFVCSTHIALSRLQTSGRQHIVELCARESTGRGRFYLSASRRNVARCALCLCCSGAVLAHVTTDSRSCPLTGGLPSTSRSDHDRRRSSVRCMASTAGTIRREVINRSQRLKLDPDDDRRFYDIPRFVNHVDDHFLQCVTALYRQRIPKDGAVLDIMSSHVSHLPKDVSYSRVVGHGMNALELAKNPQLTTFFVRNFNLEPSNWSLADNSMDAVTCCVSVQYLQQPEKVFAEVYRVLKPGGVAIFSFSNRMFYTKAIRAWTDATEYGRVSLVKQYFQCIEGFTPPEEIEEVDTSQEQPQGLAAFVSKLQGFSQNDPFYAIVAYKDHKPTSV